jgi:excisionase family DNA binding protein
MQLMSIEDLAAYLGDSKRTIYKYIASGDCPPYMRISAKNIKFDRADVDAWLESKKVQPGPGGKRMNKLNVVGYVKGVMGNIPRAGKLPWTPRAQAVLEEAQKKAREDGVGLLGSEHILFGIMSVEECLGATILGSLGVTPSTLSDRYERSSKPSARKEAGEGKPSEHIDRLIQCAAEQAAQWGHEYIGAEHLLAGILLAGTGLGFQILTDLDITLEKVRQETAKLVVCRPAPGQ